MEFPDLGKHCSKENCNQLDFLPVKCDACEKIFCHGHFRYDEHQCTESHRKDNQVPVCPLCSVPIAMRKGQPPDLVVGQHIDNDCQVKKKTSNKCSFKGCRQKELIPVICDKCHKNFCLRHRLSEDHQCNTSISNVSSQEPGSAVARQVRSHWTEASKNPFKSTKQDKLRLAQSSNHAKTTVSHSQVNAGMTEDEALARAMAMSMSEDPPAQMQQDEHETLRKLQQEQDDEALARALQQEEHGRNGATGSTVDQRTRSQSSNSAKSSCQVS